MLSSVKDIGIALGVMASIIGAGVGYGRVSAQVDNTIKVVAENKKETVKDVDEIKEELREKRAVDLQQSIILNKTVFQLERNTKILDKIEDKMDK